MVGQIGSFGYAPMSLSTKKKLIALFYLPTGPLRWGFLNEFLSQTIVTSELSRTRLPIRKRYRIVAVCEAFLRRLAKGPEVATLRCMNTSSIHLGV